MFTTLSAAVLIVSSSLALNADANPNDVDAVRAAVLDYVEGVYEVAPERIDFGGVSVGSTQERTVTVENKGESTLVLSSIAPM